MIRLTKKEYEVLTELMNGTNSADIGKKLSMSRKTVEVHRYRILKKVPAAKNMLHLVVILIRKGIVY
jgi:DNA-binding NarL/FixJ family response regulator